MATAVTPYTSAVTLLLLQKMIKIGLEALRVAPPQKARSSNQRVIHIYMYILYHETYHMMRHAYGTESADERAGQASFSLFMASSIDTW